jgi:hypothetical protein
LLSCIQKNLNDEIVEEYTQMTDPIDDYLYESTEFERKTLKSGNDLIYFNSNLHKKKNLFEAAATINTKQYITVKLCLN